MDRLVNTLAQQPAAQTLAQTTAQQVATAILANPAAQSSSSSSAVQVPAQNPVVQRPAQQPTTTALTPSSSVTGKQRLGQSSSSSSSSAAASSATSSSSASELEPTNYAATSQSEVSMAAPVGTQGQCEFQRARGRERSVRWRVRPRGEEGERGRGERGE